MPADGESTWSLPGGRVEHTEDPIDAVIREVDEETGCDAVVERLLGVDSRVIPIAELREPGPVPHQNVGIFYQVRITGGELRPEPDGDIAESVWTPIAEVAAPAPLLAGRRRPRAGADHAGDRARRRRCRSAGSSTTDSAARAGHARRAGSRLNQGLPCRSRVNGEPWKPRMRTS